MLFRSESTCNAGNTGSNPGSGRSPGGGNGNPLQYSCLENPMDRGAWWATVNGIARVRHDIVQQLSSNNCILFYTSQYCKVSVQPHRRQLTRLLHPWDSPGKNTGIGCHFLLQCMEVKIESEGTHSCSTLHDHMDGSLPGSSVHGIFQARILEWVSTAFSM